MEPAFTANKNNSSAPKYDPGVRALCEAFATTYMQHETSCGATRFEMEQDRIAASELLNFVLEANNASEILVGDVGCGDGRHERAFRGVHRVKYVGVDVASNMVQEAARWAPKALLTQADASQLPFRAASFDLLLLTFGFCSFGGRGAIAEASRVLRDGGFAMFSAYNRHALNLLLSSHRNGRTAAQINPEHDTMTVAGNTFRCEMFSPMEFRQTIQRAGFSVLQQTSSLGLASIVGPATLVRIMSDIGVVSADGNSFTRQKEAYAADERLASGAGVGMYLTVIARKRIKRRTLTSGASRQDEAAVPFRRVA